MKLKALEMALSTGSNGSHIGGAFSAMEIFAALYSVAYVDDTFDEKRDRIIISKAHCVWPTIRPCGRKACCVRKIYPHLIRMVPLFMDTHIGI